MQRESFHFPVAMPVTANQRHGLLVRSAICVQDGSFYVWSAGSFALLRSFTLPVAPTLRPAQTTYALSPNGQLLVSAGPTLPVLLLYNIIAGQLLYGVGLPARPTGTDVLAGVAVMDDESPEEAAAAAALGVSGSTALATVMPMSVGVVQVQFLPDSCTVAALLTDGSVQFVDVVDGSHVGAVPYQFPNRRDCRFSMDPRAQHMALLSNGKVKHHTLGVVGERSQRAGPRHRCSVSPVPSSVWLYSWNKQRCPACPFLLFVCSIRPVACDLKHLPALLASGPTVRPERNAHKCQPASKLAACAGGADG